MKDLAVLFASLAPAAVVLLLCKPALPRAGVARTASIVCGAVLAGVALTARTAYAPRADHEEEAQRLLLVLPALYTLAIWGMYAVKTWSVSGDQRREPPSGPRGFDVILRDPDKAGRREDNG